MRSETALDNWMVVEGCPNVKEEGGGSIPSYEFSSLLDGKLVKWLIVSCALALACRPSIFKIKLGHFRVF